MEGNSFLHKIMHSLMLISWKNTQQTRNSGKWKQNIINLYFILFICKLAIETNILFNKTKNIFNFHNYLGLYKMSIKIFNKIIGIRPLSLSDLSEIFWVWHNSRNLSGLETDNQKADGFQLTELTGCSVEGFVLISFIAAFRGKIFLVIEYCRWIEFSVEESAIFTIFVSKGVNGK